MTEEAKGETADRFADHVTLWRDRGWCLVPDVIDIDTVDRAVPDIWEMLPKPDDLFDNPRPVDRARFFASRRSDGVSLYRGKQLRHRPEQFAGIEDFPFPGEWLNRLIVDDRLLQLARAMLGEDIRLYQAQVWMKYAGVTDYEQAHHLDFQGHSLLTPSWHEPCSQAQLFLFLSDIEDGDGPSAYPASASRSARPSWPARLEPRDDPDLYRDEKIAFGRRGSVLAMRFDTWHRATNLTRPRGHRAWLIISFRKASDGCIGFQSFERLSLSDDWNRFVGMCTPEQLAVFGFPSPGDPRITSSMVDELQQRYPSLDTGPWRSALALADAVPVDRRAHAGR